MAWKCQRVKAGVKCGHVNPNRLRKCERCLKLRRPRKQPAHRAALSLSYDAFVALNGGEHCGICGAVQKPGGRRLHRDHDHSGYGTPRGILCFRCNSALRPYMTAEWLLAAANYLERAERIGYARDVSNPKGRL